MKRRSHPFAVLMSFPRTRESRHPHPVPPPSGGRGLNREFLRQKGVTLVELIAFILVAAALGAGLVAAFTSAMRDTPKSNEITQALQLAQERMELILAYKKSKGFTALVDPCTLASPPAQCTSFPSGFNAPTVTIVNNWNGSNAFKVVTVNVTGPQTITLAALVASY